MVQQWLVDENGEFINAIDDCVEISHEPDDEDMWECDKCGYSDAGEKFETPDDDNDEEERVVPAKKLPEGWEWVHYDDGSGHLQNNSVPPQMGYCFSYDRTAYSHIEYRMFPTSDWEMYHGSFDDFIDFAEECILRLITSPEV